MLSIDQIKEKLCGCALLVLIIVMITEYFAMYDRAHEQYMANPRNRLRNIESILDRLAELENMIANSTNTRCVL